MSTSSERLRVGIVGTGSIGLGSAAFLATRNHRPMLWSPSGSGTRALAGAIIATTGAVTTECRTDIAKNAQELLESCDIIKIATPAYAHKTVMDAIIPHLQSRHAVIISSHASFGALYLSRQAAGLRAARPLIIAWGTTLLTGRKTGAARVTINTVRSQVDLATVPQARAEEALALCRRLFGDSFVMRDGLLAIAVSNLNPQNHLGIALCNLTRMEKGEDWVQAENVTPAVGRLLERLDDERLAIAAALGLKVRNIFDHFRLSFHVTGKTVAEMSSAMAESGNRGRGPASADSRYVTEDVPFGLVPTAWLGRLVGRPAHLHEAGITLFSALYGRDFRQENDLFEALKLGELSLDDLIELSRTGVPVKDNMRGNQGRPVSEQAIH